MTALAELMTADMFGRLRDVPVVEPLPEGPSGPVSWRRVAAWTTVTAVLFCWSFAMGALYLAEWRAGA